MRLRRQVIGALNLFGAPPGLGLADTQVAQALADVATIGLLQHRAQRRAESVVTQLQTALNSRVLIEQAKGVLAERLDIDMNSAFSVLRDHARSTNRHLSDTAQAVIEGTADFGAMERPAGGRL
jgi:AmiR/NasT family two-component response regulator